MGWIDIITTLLYLALAGSAVYVGCCLYFKLEDLYEHIAYHDEILRSVEQHIAQMDAFKKQVALLESRTKQSRIHKKDDPKSYILQALRIRYLKNKRSIGRREIGYLMYVFGPQGSMKELDVTLDRLESEGKLIIERDEKVTNYRYRPILEEMNEQKDLHDKN